MRLLATRRRPVPAVLVAMMLMGACAGGDEPAAAPPASEPAIVFQDDLGPVELGGPASRIVTTTDETTELVVALGLQPVGIGSTRLDTVAAEAGRYDGYYLSADQLGTPRFVGGDIPNLEVIASLDPDLILHYAEDDSLARMGEIAPTAVFDTTVPGAWQEALRQLGTATGHEDRAADVISRYDADVEAAKLTLRPIVDEHPRLTVVYPNYRGGDQNFVFSTDFGLVSFVPQIGFDLVGFDVAAPAFPGVGEISTERYTDLAALTDTIVAVGTEEWRSTPSAPFLEALPVPVLGVQIDEGRPSTGPLSAPTYLASFVDVLVGHYR